MKLTQSMLRRMRITGLAAFFGNTFLFLAYSIFVAFNIFSLIPIVGLRTIVFWVLFGIMIGGFCLLFLGSRLQKMVETAETRAKGAGNRINQANLSKSDVEFINQQQEYASPKGPEGRDTMKFLGITLLVIVLAIIFWDLSLNPLARGFYAYSVALGAIAIACLVALVSGNVSEDLWRAYLAGYHVHESFVGIYFAIIGGPMVALAAFSVEYYLGLSYVISGVFLVGRDWKDVVQGKILVHKSKEPDYEQYAALKAKKKQIQGV
jgi:hypothetical protein